MVFVIIAIIGFVSTAAYIVLSLKDIKFKTAKERKDRISKTISMSILSIISTLTFALLSNWIYDAIKEKMKDTPTVNTEQTTGTNDSISFNEVSDVNTTQDTTEKYVSDSENKTTVTTVPSSPLLDNCLTTTTSQTIIVTTTSETTVSHETELYTEETTTATTTNKKSNNDLILHRDEKNEKWGYIDQFGNTQIPYIYDYADEFVDSYAAVMKDYSWGFIDKNGNEVIPFEYNGAFSFVNGLAPVFKDNLWGFIDESGNIVIPFQYTDIALYHSNIDNSYTFLDENNKEIVFPIDY